MNDEIKDQRIGSLRYALVEVKQMLGHVAAATYALERIDAALKEDNELAGYKPLPPGEQVRELAAAHRETALNMFKTLVFGAGMTIPEPNARLARDFVDELVAAAGYEAEWRARLRGGQ